MGAGGKWGNIIPRARVPEKFSQQIPPIQRVRIHDPEIPGESQDIPDQNRKFTGCQFRLSFLYKMWIERQNRYSSISRHAVPGLL